MNVSAKKAVWMALVSLAACSKPSDTPSQGEITITADESLQPMVNDLCKAYEGVNPKAKFNVLYQPEQQAIGTMLQNGSRMVFSTRELNKEEKGLLNQKQLKVKTQFIATDGIALIVGQANKDSLMTTAQLADIFQGKITRWEQLKGATSKGPIVLVFDNNSSSNLLYMLNRFKINDLKQLKIFTVKSNKQVIDYVKKTPLALGFIGVNWISDGDVPLTAELSKDLRVLGVSEKANPTSISDYYQPFQKNLGLEYYPFRRKVYIISREAHSGLGGGMMTYIARDVGGLIIEKSGLWPAIPYNREIYLQKR